MGTGWPGAGDAGGRRIRRLNEDFYSGQRRPGTSSSAAALVIGHQPVGKLVDGSRVHRLGEDHEDVEPADAVGVHEHRVEAVIGQHLPPPLGGRQVALSADPVRVDRVVPVDVDGQPAGRSIAAGRVDAELAARLGLPEVLAQGIVVQVDFSPLGGERAGDKCQGVPDARADRQAGGLCGPDGTLSKWICGKARPESTTSTSLTPVGGQGKLVPSCDTGE